MAAEKFPGKGAKPGMYKMPNGDERYYAGGNDFYRSAPGGGAQLFGELTNGSGWRGMSQFDGFNDGRSKGGVKAQNSNPFAQNFQTFYSPNDSPLRSLIGPNPEDPNKTPEVTATTAPTVPTRDVPKANGAKGTQTSPGGGMPTLTAATVAQRLGASNIGLGAYSSIQLPGTATNPNTGRPIEAQPFSGQEPAVTSNTLGAFSNNGVNFAALDNTGVSTQDAFTNPALKGVVGDAFAQYGTLGAGNGAFAKPTQGSNTYTEISPTNPIYAEAFGEDLAKKNGSTGSSRLDAALADTAGMRSYMSKFGSPEQDRRRAAEMAFLNTEGPGSSLMGVRAKEDVLGQFYAGGKTYQLNDAGTELLQSKKGGPLAMDPKAASAYRLGTMDAETYKNSYKDAVKDVTASETPVTPKQAESPFVHNPAAVNTEFRTDISAGTMAPGSAEVGGMMDAVRGIDGTPPLSSQQISDSFLNKREPLMRDPRKK